MKYSLICSLVFAGLIVGCGDSSPATKADAGATGGGVAGGGVAGGGVAGGGVAGGGVTTTATATATATTTTTAKIVLLIGSFQNSETFNCSNLDVPFTRKLLCVFPSLFIKCPSFVNNGGIRQQNARIVTTL